MSCFALSRQLVLMAEQKGLGVESCWSPSRELGPSHFCAPGRTLLTACVSLRRRKQLGIWGKLPSTSLISLPCRQKGTTRKETA